MSETDEILKSLEDPTPQKKPTNWELWAALYFAEFIFVMLDAGSAVSVGVITGYWYYGAIVFLAGVVPLWLYTKTYTRPLADANQKRAALIGGIVAVGSVLVVGLFVAILNFAAKTMNGDSLTWVEVGLAVSLVLLLAVHGFINAYYFFTDDQVKEYNKTQRMIARGDAHVKRIHIAQTVANAKRREVTARQRLEKEFSPAIVARIMSMMADDDGDGIPNFIDPVDNRKNQPVRQFANETENPTSAGSQSDRTPRKDNSQQNQ